VPDDAISWNFPRTPVATQVLLEVAREERMSASECLAGTRLTLADLQDQQLEIEAEQELTAIRNLMRHTHNRPGLGVRAGGKATVGMLGIWGFAMLSSNSTRGIADIAMRFGYGRFSWAFLRPWVDEVSGKLHVIYDDSNVPKDVLGFLTERDLTFTAALVPQFFGRQLPLHIRTTLGPAVEPAFAAVLPGAALEFGADRNEQILSEAALAAMPPRADPYALRICENQCEILLARRTHRTGVAAVVRSSLLRLPPGSCSLGVIARERGVDPRTLRRQLVAEGTSFRELADEVHETLATELLSTGGLTVEQVAQRLGYAEAASFSRAYKRWTGNTPGATGRELSRA
jgi:AraC-like DNA-binding protein